MSDPLKNKLSAQLIKAEMLGDQDKIERIKKQLDDFNRSPAATSGMTTKSTVSKTRAVNQKPDSSNSHFNKSYNSKARKFLESSGSLSQMFEQEKRLSSSDEVKMYVKTSAKFSRDDMETKHFSEEIDDSQAILNKSKRHKPDSSDYRTNSSRSESGASCGMCPNSLKHLLVEQSKFVYLSLIASKPFLSSMSNVLISNIDHSIPSLVTAPYDHYLEVTRMVETLKTMWSANGYRCLIMETFFRERKSHRREPISGGDHYQVHCMPIKEKHFERSRMIFKQALQDCEQEWSMNKKLIVFDGRRIQRCLPAGLSYFWVCFDSLSNGFGHVIESENEFSSYFGLEVLSSLLDKEFNPMRLNQHENFDDQFVRCRTFKLDYLKFKRQQEDE